jgi:opacity protein-like surface antigen
MPMRISARSTSFQFICRIAVLVAALLAGSAHGQVIPSAKGPGHTLWVGGEYSNLRASFPYGSHQHLWGIGGIANYSLVRFLGIEAEGRYLGTNGFYSEKQQTFMVGPQCIAGRSEILQPFAQFLIGAGGIEYPQQAGNGVHLALASGAGVNLRFMERWMVRGEYEYQLWLGPSVIANQPTHYITPNGFHVSVAYRLFR